MWQGQESANYPFSQHFGNPSKWPTVTQSLLKAGLLSQRFLAVAALALRACYPLVYWGKKEIPSFNGKNLIFFLKREYSRELSNYDENAKRFLKVHKIRRTRQAVWSSRLQALAPSFGFWPDKLGFLGRTSPCSVHSIPALDRTI